MEVSAELAAKLAPDHPIFKVLERLALVEDKLKKQDPEISTHLAVIHKEMGQYEELAHLLSPEQIGVLMSGLQKHSSIQLVMEDQGKRKKSKKVGVDDLI